ncbi:hypothetical protein ACCS78_36270, partial [Rhizobium johnstonii]
MVKLETELDPERSFHMRYAVRSVFGDGARQRQMSECPEPIGSRHRELGTSWCADPTVGGPRRYA